MQEIVAMRRGMGAREHRAEGFTWHDATFLPQWEGSMRSEDHLGSDNNGGTYSIFGSFGRTVRGVIRNAQEIIHSEVQLAKAEIKEELRRAARVVAFYAAAGICALFALGFILWAAVYGLRILYRFGWPR